ncbi:MAG: tetratricopeptide repeat protein [Acaryochloridaceae cyanobacterium CSU_5_19]|nr:tetratricopeptide repeat protein [Acaryochloridaceae cyanobacterium CSU_5_19]
MFDWRLGVWDFGEDSLFQPEPRPILPSVNGLKYATLSAPERTQRILKLQDLLAEVGPQAEERSSWSVELGYLFAAGADYRSAIAQYDQALALNPKEAEVWYSRGVALGDWGHQEDEIASYDKALLLKPDQAQAWTNRGDALFHLGRYEEAIASYDKALALQPNISSIWANRGVVLASLGRFSEAIDSFDKSLRLEPDADPVWVQRSIVLGYLDQPEAAILSYDKALRLNQTSLKLEEAGYCFI